MEIPKLTRRLRRFQEMISDAMSIRHLQVAKVTLLRKDEQKHCTACALIDKRGGQTDNGQVRMPEAVLTKAEMRLLLHAGWSSSNASRALSCVTAP
jgi:hypothetical protein